MKKDEEFMFPPSIAIYLFFFLYNRDITFQTLLPFFDTNICNVQQNHQTIHLSVVALSIAELFLFH